MFDRFTDAARLALKNAREVTLRCGEDSIDTVHILAGLSWLEGDAAAALLLEFGIDGATLADHLPRAKEPSWRSTLPFTPAGKGALEITSEVASSRDHARIGTLHLLFGVLRGFDDRVRSLLERVRPDSAALLERVCRALEDPKLRERPGERAMRSHGEAALARTAARRLEDRAIVELSEPFTAENFRAHVARPELQERLQLLLSRRHRPNVVLVGEPGVGKTALVELLARDIAQGHGPRAPASSRIVRVDLAALLLDIRKFRTPEWNLARAIERERRSPGAILFVEDLLLIAPYAATDEIRTPGFGDLVRPSLDSGELRCIATATASAWARFAESNPVLATRFHPLEVPPASFETTRRVVLARRAAICAHHRVAISDAAVDALLKVAWDLPLVTRAPGSVLAVLDLASAHAAERRRGRPVGAGREVEVWDIANAIEWFSGAE